MRICEAKFGNLFFACEAALARCGAWRVIICRLRIRREAVHVRPIKGRPMGRSPGLRVIHIRRPST